MPHKKPEELLLPSIFLAFVVLVLATVFWIRPADQMTSAAIIGGLVNGIVVSGYLWYQAWEQRRTSVKVEYEIRTVDNAASLVVAIYNFSPLPIYVRCRVEGGGKILAYLRNWSPNDIRDVSYKLLLLSGDDGILELTPVELNGLMGDTRHLNTLDLVVTSQHKELERITITL